eukprot:9250447-Pyramimonas_sp.AAC.1
MSGRTSHVDSRCSSPKSMIMVQFWVFVQRPSSNGALPSVKMAPVEAYETRTLKEALLQYP